MKRKRKPTKRLAARRKKKKQNGIRELLEVIVETAMAGLKIYRKAKPLMNHIRKKGKKKNGK